MLEGLRERYYAAVRRARRIERRELRELRRWLGATSTLVHLSVLVVVPLLIGLVTYLSNAVSGLSFLLFPPLASGSYTLFADPEGRYASPVQFVAGLTIGAGCGWLALLVGEALFGEIPAGTLHAGAVEAALSVFLAGVVTWLIDVEEPAAYSTALLALLVPKGTQPEYLVSVLASSAIVATVFTVWREQFYEQRAEILYESTSGDDHVLVPMRGEYQEATAILGARLAAAHDAGKVVLLDVVEDAERAQRERELLQRHESAALAPRERERGSGSLTGEAVATDADVSSTVRDLEERAGAIETRVGVPCQVVVAVSGGSLAATVGRAARETGCDLVVAPFETRHGGLAPYLRELFRSRIDVLIHQSQGGRTRWRSILVTVRGASDVSHSMVEFAMRLAGPTGRVSVTHCIDRADQRRRAERMLADLVEPFEGTFETRVSTRSVERFLAENAGDADLVVVGASQDRSAASRLLSPPTFERIRDVDADVAIVDRS